MHKHEACSLNYNGWCEIDHDKYKIVNCVKIPLHIDIYNSSFYKNKANKYWPNVNKTNYIPVTEGDYLECYETEYFHHILRFPEFTPNQLKEVLFFICNVLEYCIEEKIYLPTHLWNITFYRGEPIIIDIRDFQKLTEKCKCKFPNWEHIKNGYKLCKDCNKECKIHNLSQIFTHIISNNLEDNSGKHISNYFTEYGDFINCLKNNKKLNINQIKQSIKKCKVIDYNKNNYLEDFNNYYNSFDKILENEYKNKKGKCPERLFAKLTNFAKSHCPKIITLDQILSQFKPKTVIDIGCNTGVMSLICSKYSHVIGVDFNPIVIDRANKLSKKFKTNTQFICTNILDIEKNDKLYGKKGCYGNIYERFKSDMLIVFNVFDYMFKSLIYGKCYSTKNAIQFILNIFIKLSTKYIVFENLKKKEHNNIVYKYLKKKGWKKTKLYKNNIYVFIKG
jgi:SAM-dependent methyltransferase